MQFEPMQNIQTHTLIRTNLGPGPRQSSTTLTHRFGKLEASWPPDFLHGVPNPSIYPVFQAPRLANVHFPVGKPENVDPPLWGDAIVAAHAGIRIHSCHTLRKTYTLTQVSARACAALPEMNSQTELSLQEDDTALVTALKLNTTAHTHTHQWQTQTLTTPSLSLRRRTSLRASFRL